MSQEKPGLSELMAHKKEAKATLKKKLGLRGTRMVVAVFVDQELNELEHRLLVDVAEAVKNIEAELVILADQGFEAAGCDLAVIGSAKVMEYSRGNRGLLLEAADICLAFDFNDVEELLLNGVVPVSPARAGISDYDPNHETGNAFVVHSDNVWGRFAGLVRAAETYKFPYDWKHIVRQGLESCR